MTNIEEEIWKDIEGYEGYYQISSLGQVKSLNRYIICKDGRIKFIKGKTLRPSKNDGGYYSINLYLDGARINHFVHRLVATTFIPNLNNLPEINHIKEFEKWNNSVDNLEWCDRIYNANYGTGKVRMGLAHATEVYQYDLDLNLIKRYNSVIEALNETNNGKGTSFISKCSSGKQVYCKKYIWSYIPLTEMPSNIILRRVYKYDNEYNLIKIYDNPQEVKEDGYSSNTVTQFCNNYYKGKTHKGYFWSYRPLHATL